MLPLDNKKLAKILKALANENRLEIYMQIVKNNEQTFEAKKECLVCDIITNLNICAPTISHHIKELTNVDLIFTEKRGKYLVAKPNKELIQQVCTALQIDM